MRFHFDLLPATSMARTHRAFFGLTLNDRVFASFSVLAPVGLWFLAYWIVLTPEPESVAATFAVAVRAVVRALTVAVVTVGAVVSSRMSSVNVWFPSMSVPTNRT